MLQLTKTHSQKKKDIKSKNLKVLYGPNFKYYKSIGQGAFGKIRVCEVSSSSEDKIMRSNTSDTFDE
jgi:hypothetical protein